VPAKLAGYDDLFADVAEVIEEARRSAGSLGERRDDGHLLAR
jgi:hypothetical protein